MKDGSGFTPIPPMLAKRVEDLPEAGEWIFEPKWDGFRVVVFRDGDDLLLQSRDLKPLDRYFPELMEPLRAQLPQRCVLDGEIVIARERGLDFDALTLRIHPAASRVKTLSEQMPASVVFFDLLSEGDHDLRSEPFEERRKKVERGVGGCGGAAAFDSRNALSRCGAGLVSTVRGCGPRWRDGEGCRQHVPARQTHHAEGEA